MMKMAPPEPPLCVGLDDDDRARRLRFRLWQLLMTAATVLITAWVCTLNKYAAIIALMVAKHVLVALLAMDLGVDAGRRRPV